MKHPILIKNVNIVNEGQIEIAEVFIQNGSCGYFSDKYNNWIPSLFSYRAKFLKILNK